MLIVSKLGFSSGLEDFQRLVPPFFKLIHSVEFYLHCKSEESLILSAFQFYQLIKALKMTGGN